MHTRCRRDRCIQKHSTTGARVCQKRSPYYCLQLLAGYLGGMRSEATRRRRASCPTIDTNIRHVHLPRVETHFYSVTCIIYSCQNTREQKQKSAEFPVVHSTDVVVVAKPSLPFVVVVVNNVSVPVCRSMRSKKVSRRIDTVRCQQNGVRFGHVFEQNFWIPRPRNETSCSA